MKLTCQCCLFEQDFADEEDAFQKGWDAPPHFTGFVACNLCPASYLILGENHSMAHADWESHGRPEQFNNRCLADKNYQTKGGVN